MSDDKLPVRDQHFDGIQEDDNPLPNWWKQILYVSIAFSAVYMLLFHTSFILSRPSPQAEFQAELAAMQAHKDSMEALMPAFTEELLARIQKDQAAIARGEKTFVANCAACHGMQGGGSIGPNLADNFWIHGARIDQVATTIRKGVGDKGMPTWDNLLSRDQIAEVAAYVKSLRGRNPPGAKAPQGVLDTL